MSTLQPKQLLEVLNWRYATKKFDAQRKIDAAVWDTLEESLVLSPSSFGLQPWKFVVVTRQDLKSQLSSVSWGQTQPIECSHFVVFTVRRGLNNGDVDRFLKRSVEVMGRTLESFDAYKNVMVGSLDRARSAGYLDAWQAHQVYIALGQFMAAAALLGIDTCPMEGIDPARYDQILGLEGSGYFTAVACAAGYRSSEDKYAQSPKVRFPRSEVIQHL